MQGKSIFISYAHADPENFIDEIHRHLRITFRGIKQFELWTDDRIRVTEAWDGEIKDALRRSRCAILLVSANFLDSEYVFEQELPIILSRSKDEQLGLIPVFVSKVPKRSLKVPFPYRGRTEEFDLASQQGPNGPDNPLDRMGEAERNALLASLADQVAEWLEEQEPSRPDEERPARVKSAPPPVSPADARPELCVQLERWNGKLQRRYFFEGYPQPREFPIRETDAESDLRYWDPCLPYGGEQLYALLFGAEPQAWARILAAALGLEDGEPVAPTRHPLRIRVLTGDEDLIKLPWASLSHQGIALKESGWSVELSPQTDPDERPRFASHNLSMPGPTLLVFSRPLYREGHLDDVTGLFRALYPKQSALFEAHDLEALELELRERAPRLFYYFGSGRWDKASGSYLLEMPDRGGRMSELPVQDLADHFSAKPPQVVFLNLIDDQGCHGLPAARRLLARAKAVVVNCAAQQAVAQAAETGYRWLEHLLVHRSDPVIAFHHAGAACGGCWTAYQGWRTDSAGSIDDDLVEYFLDRNEQSEHLLGACGELVNRDSPLRVQFRLAVGAQGNRVMDFGRQAVFYLAENAFAGTYSYARGPLRLYGEITSPAAVETCYRRHHRLGPHADLFGPLRIQAPAYGVELQVPLLCWAVEAEDETPADETAEIAKAVLEWTWEVLAIGCPDDLRIISLLLVETRAEDAVDRVKRALREHERALRSRAGPRASFKFREMRRLAGVDETHLRDYFDSPTCWCWDSLKPSYPGWLLGGREEMPFAEAVRLIKQAKRMGWGRMAEQLRKAPGRTQ